MPGFNDAHMHLRDGALSLERLDLFGLTGLDDVLRAIADYASRHVGDAWLTGSGWLYAAFPGGLPTRQQLDSIVPDRPVYLVCFDGHTGWANTRALQLAGIDERTPDPLNGEIVRDATGQPTGALKERASELVARHVPEPDEETMLGLLARALDELARKGITAAQDAWATPADLALFNRLRGRTELPVRLRVALELKPEQARAGLAATLDEFEAAAAALEGDELLRGGIIKSFVDGVVEARTAYMLEPYPGTDSCGDPRWTDDELRATVGVLHRRGWQVELHAIGTAAVRQALGAYAALGRGAAERRHRIEHIETIDPADLPRFAELGVVASIQPLHAIPDSSQADTWSGMLDPGVAVTGWRTRSLLESGAVVAIGTDWPVVPFDPLLSIHAAVTRRAAAGGGAAFAPAEAVSMERALTAYTWGSAYAEHAEEVRGSLAAGRAADLIVLDRDLLDAGSDALAILGTEVRLTLVGGRTVHRAA